MKSGGKPFAVVADVQLDDAVFGGRRQRHVAGAVTERVLDEIPERLLEPHAIAAQAEPRRRVDREGAGRPPSPSTRSA